MWRWFQVLIKAPWLCLSVTQQFAVLPCKLSFQYGEPYLSPTCALTHLLSTQRTNLCVYACVRECVHVSRLILPPLWRVSVSVFCVCWTPQVEIWVEISHLAAVMSCNPTQINQNSHRIHTCNTELPFSVELSFHCGMITTKLWHTVGSSQ